MHSSNLDMLVLMLVILVDTRAAWFRPHEFNKQLDLTLRVNHHHLAALKQLKDLHGIDFTFKEGLHHATSAEVATFRDMLARHHTTSKSAQNVDLLVQAAQPDSALKRHRSAQPMGNRSKTRRLAFYDRYLGRFNNQLFQFVSALQIATVTNRTLVVPPERTKRQWTGMGNPELKLWDLSVLKEAYDFEFYDAHNPSHQVDIPAECRASKSRDMLSLPDECESIHLGGYYGLLMCTAYARFCGSATQERIAYDIYSKLRLHPRMERYTNTAASIGVHSRSFMESKNPKTCPHVVRKGIRSHLNNPKHLKEARPYRDLALGACTLWRNKSLERILEHYGQDVKGRFELSSDFAHDWSSDSRVVAVKVKVPPPLKAVPNDWAIYRATQADVERITMVIVDIWKLVSPRFFVGQVYSTLTFTVCMLRGEIRKYDSNVCWILMHPETRYATLPSYDQQRTHRS